MALLMVVMPVVAPRWMKVRLFAPGTDVEVSTRDCNVLVKHGSGPAGVAVHYWHFVGFVQQSTDSRGRLRVTVDMRPQLSSWLACRVTVIAPEEPGLQRLRIHLRRSVFPVSAVLLTGRVAGDVHVSARANGLIQVSGTRCGGVARLCAEAGHVSLHLGEHRAGAREWLVESTSAPVVVKASEALEVHMRSKQFAALAGAAVKELGSAFVVCAAKHSSASTGVAGLGSRLLLANSKVNSVASGCSPVQALRFNSSGDAGLYAEVGNCDGGSSCEVIRWAENQGLRLTPSSEQAVEDVRRFMEMSGRRLWEVSFVVASTRGQGPPGLWTAASTTGCRTLGATLLRVFSFGLIWPATISRTLQLQGSASDERPSLGQDKDEEDEKSDTCANPDELDAACPSWKQSQQVAALLFKQLNGSVPGGLILESSAACAGGLHFTQGPAGEMNVYLAFGAVNWGLVLAMLMNLICAFLLTATVVMVVRGVALPFLEARTLERMSKITASQRLNIARGGSEWALIASFRHLPQRGIHLSWERTQRVRNARRIRVSFAQLWGGERTAEKSVTVQMAELDEITADSCAFLLDLEYAGFPREGVQLVLRVTALSVTNHVLDSTPWSAPVLVEPSHSMAQLPFQLLATITGTLNAEAAQLGLSEFIACACERTKPPSLTLVSERLHVALDKEDVAKPFRVELFFGESRWLARRMTMQGNERSFASSKVCLRAPEEAQPSTAKGWTGNDYNGFDLVAEGAGRFELEPPFRDGMRFGAPLFVHVVSDDGNKLLASGQAAWDDLLGSYNIYRSVDQQHTFEVAILDNDGDQVGGLCMWPTFVSDTLRSLGKEPLSAEANWFRDDVPGDTYQQGMDRFVAWKAERAGEGGSEAWRCKLWLEQAGRPALSLVATEVRFIAETFAWVVDADFSNGPYACCRLILERGQPPSEGKPRSESGESAPQESAVICRSNWFVVVQTLTLGEFERAYGAFCRMNGIEMEAIDLPMLEAMGLQLVEKRVRGCSGLRRPLPFEALGADIIQCAGGLLLTAFTHHVVGKDRKDEHFRLRSHRVMVLQGLHLVPSVHRWRPQFVFKESLSCVYVVNDFAINSALTLGLDAMASRAGGRWLTAALGVCWGRLLWPVTLATFVLLLHIYQLLCFMTLPIMATLLLLFVNYVDSRDPMPTLDLSEPPPEILVILPRTKICVEMLAACAAMIAAALLVANALPTFSLRLTAAANKVLMASAWTNTVLLFALFVMLLCFLVGALLDPDQTLVALVMVGSSIGLVVSMWKHYAGLMGSVQAAIQNQLDSTMNIIVDSLIERLGIDGVGEATEAEDLKLVRRQADNSFRGRGPEGEDLPKENCRCRCKESAELKEMQGKVTSTSASGAGGGKGEAVDTDTAVSGGGGSERLKRLKKLYQFYLGKTALDKNLEWRISEEVDALTDVMLCEHHKRLALLNFEGVEGTNNDAGPEPDREKRRQSDAGKRGPGLQASPTKKRLPKAYAIYRASFREHLDTMAQQVVEWVDPLLKRGGNAEKVTDFYDNRVPKFVQSCALATFNSNLSGSKTAEVLAGVTAHAEACVQRDPAATLTFEQLYLALKDGQQGLALGLLPAAAVGADGAALERVFDERKVRSYLKGVVKQVLPNFGQMQRVPLYKLPRVIEKLVAGKVWWCALQEFLLDDCGFTKAEIDLCGLAKGFLEHSDGAGFLAVECIADVLMYLTDGGLWKAAAVALLREIGVCGELGNARLGSAADEEARMHEGWSAYVPDWPDLVMERWRWLTDETDSAAGFLQKSDVTSFVEHLMLDLMLDRKRRTHLSAFGDRLQPIRGFSDWAYEPLDGLLGCPRAIWRYVDNTHLEPLRGLPWEAFDALLERFDLDIPEPVSRQVFSESWRFQEPPPGRDDPHMRQTPSGWLPLFISPRTCWRAVEDLVDSSRAISLAGFRKVLRRAGITLPDPVTKMLFDEMDDIKIGSAGYGGRGYACQDLVDFDDLAPLVPKYLSGGMWLEAVHGLLQKEEIEIQFSELAKAFTEVDKQGLGVLMPSKVIDLLRSLQRTGIDYQAFHDMITQDMHLKVGQRQLRLIFNMVDVSGTGSITEMEFTQGFDKILGSLLPAMLLESLGLLPEQVFQKVLCALLLLLLIFAFITLSMRELTSAEGGSDFRNVVQSVVAAAAALGVRAQQTTGLDVTEMQGCIVAAISSLMPMAVKGQMSRYSLSQDGD